MSKERGIIPGLRPHGHSGKAYSNERNLGNAGFDATDASLRGVGKGLGTVAGCHSSEAYIA